MGEKRALGLAVGLALACAAAAGRAPTWRATWVWDGGERAPRNAYLYVRKSFVLPGRVGKAVAHVSADSRYRLWVNGQLVGAGPARCDPQHQYFDTLDIRAALRPGQNAIAALVHHYGVGTQFYVPGAAGFLFQADIASAGETVRVQTDGTWVVLPARGWRADVPRVNPKGGFLEVFDARREPVGWRSATFGDFDWHGATVVGPALGTKPWAGLVASPVPQMARREVRAAGVVGVGQGQGGVPPPAKLAEAMATEPHADLATCAVEAPAALLARDGRCATITAAEGASAFVVLDFGREVVGRPRVVVADSRGGTLDIGYAETLTDGRVDPSRGGTLSADRLVLRPGPLTWEPFGQRAFRYLQLSLRALEGPVEIDAVTLDLEHFPVREAGGFRSSDPLLDRIWATGAYTCQLCMQDAFIDCPSRERAQWWGDARVEMQTAAYAFGEGRLAANGLRQIAWSQRRDGSVLAAYPAGGQPAVLPDYAALWVSGLREHWWLSGDDGPMRETWPQAVRLLAWFRRHVDRHGLLADVPGWTFIDAASVEKAGECAALNALYHRALRDAAAMARHLGDPAAAERYAEQADAVEGAFNARLWAADGRCYADCRSSKGLSRSRSVQANALAVLCGLADGERRRAATEHVARLIQADPTSHCSPYFMSFVLEMLFREGRAGAALGAIRRGWKVMLDGGATTWWEHWHPRASWCHAWSGAPTYLLPAWTVGVRPLAPGFAKVLIAPTLCDLEQAAASVPTPRGLVAVSVRRERDTGALTLEASVPKGAVATIALPVGGMASPAVRLDGQLVWAEGELTKQAIETFLRAEPHGERIEFDIRGGRPYRFTVAPVAK